MGILITEKYHVLPNGYRQYYRYQTDTSKSKVYKAGNRYYFNTKLIKSWIEQPIKQGN